MFKVEDASETEFNKAKKERGSDLIQDTLKIRKNNNQLHLSLSNASTKEVVLKDTLADIFDNSDFRRYTYLGQFPKINQYLIENHLYEDYKCLLINKKSGKITQIGGRPSLSPDGTYLININAAGGMGDEPIGFQIWEIKPDASLIKKIYEFDQFEWYPLDCTWQNDRTAIIKIISMKSPDYPNMYEKKSSKDFMYKKLIFN
ncbi:hypothetical protein GU926_13960 [Nibribacter ruber]|uniref:Uncharacterized protein n=1 Tax=Nibribacter ruber TaxID=2698458 RepID=A0A6P1P255_9BACT|nr:hypothetical protein [Nibribacter ruber]QHL88475.1 hypothetical protein GU926_13960 [Nibribacter ruber]